ncbi:ATP-binding protein [Salinisphaera sp. LB1]|uniref:sensor histidine kinase n=1 Tax=Salinisphaera sp. LB1 TaxID=2183911 RepID=UPI000D7063A7|nr:HAMP domain-containing sensor histidine kinase [Salinisphaera sp. LB1]AWN17791.1 Phytochrome, two-component sensor histidine kinase [Salinisphaera sp. LB1]
MIDSTAHVSRRLVYDDNGGFAERALELLLARDSSLAVCGLTLDGRVRIWHDSAERLFGHLAADVMGRRLDHLAPAENRHQGLVTRTLFGASAAGQSQLDLPLLTRAGERKNCRLEIRPQPEAEPGFAVLIHETGPAFELPSRRRARGDSRAAHRANLALIAGEPGWIGLGLEAEIKYVSPQAAECLEVVDRTWVGRPVTDLFQPADEQDWYVLLHRTVETGRPQPAVVVGVDDGPGDVCWPVTVVALHDEADNTLLGFTLALGTPEKSSDRRTAPAAGGDQSAERAWFNAVVHDLREPLRRVREYVEAARDDDTVAPGAGAAHYLARIDAAVARLQDNVGGILRLARIDSAPFVPQRIDLGALIATVVDDLGTLTREHDAVVDVGNLGVVSGDPVQLRLLFQNLIDNSIRYRRPETPPRIAITALATAPDNDTLRLRYSDNARGFDNPDAMLAGQDREAVAGTGIGLDLCRRIARRHRGDLEIAETHSQGTTFIITLTRQSEAGAGASQETR